MINVTIRCAKAPDVGIGRKSLFHIQVDQLLQVEIQSVTMGTDDDITGPINLGNPNEFTIRELAEKVISITNSKSELVNSPLPSDDPLQRQPDIRQAKAHLGWEPTIQLEQGLRKAIEYFEGML